MLHLVYVDSVVVLVCTDPLDPNDTLLEVYRHDQPVVVAFNIEHDPICGDDAGGRIATLHVRRAGPSRFFDLVEPNIQRGLERWIILIPPARVNELSQGTSGNDPHL